MARTTGHTFPTLLAEKQPGAFADELEVYAFMEDWLYTDATRRYIPADFLRAGNAAGLYIACGADAPSSVKDVANGVSDGTPGGDTAVLAAAAAQTTVRRQLLTVGSFHLNAAVAFPVVDYLRWTGLGSYIYTADVAYPTPAVALGGSRTACTISSLTDTSLAQGTNVIHATVTGCNVDDWVALTTTQGIGSRPGENFAGEWLRVESNAGGVLTFSTPFRNTYPLSAGGFTLQLYKYSLIRNPIISGVRVVGPGGNGHTTGTGTQRERMFVLSYAWDAVIADCYPEGPYAREGLATYECLRPTFLRPTWRDVNDLNGNTTTQPYEAYAIRIQGCEGAQVLDGRGSGCRHGIEANGGQGAYGLPGGQTRPLSYDTLIRRAYVVKSWAAAVGTHAGTVATVYEDIVADGSSGAIFERGTQARIRNLTYRGGTHEQGPYPANQGNDHCITLGEQQRLADNSGPDNTTRNGVSGTGVLIDGVIHDMTGNGGTLGSTSDTVHAVHPLVRTRIDLGGGVVKPTGNVVTALGSFNEDVEITGYADLSAAFSGGGRYAALTPAATVGPALTTGQQNRDITIKGTAFHPRNPPILISGSADASARSDRIDVQLKVKGLGSGMTSSSAVVVLGANPNGGTGQFGHVRHRDFECTDVAKATAVDQSAATVATLLWQGLSRFSDGTQP